MRRDMNHMTEWDRYRRRLRGLARLAGLLIGVAAGVLASRLYGLLPTDYAYDRCVIDPAGRVFGGNPDVDPPRRVALRPDQACRSIEVRSR
jgi:hypothetical protein